MELGDQKTDRPATSCERRAEADGVQSWTCAGPGSDLPPVDPLDANTSVVLRRGGKLGGGGGGGGSRIKAWCR